MNYELKHYGKEINKLSKKENELLMIDMSMTLMFKDNKDGGNKSNQTFFAMLIEQISIKRCDIILELLNLNKEVFTKTIDKLEYIETTEYGFDKFLKDTEANIKKKEIVKRLEVLN
jgi:hypothetical protein